MGWVSLAAKALGKTLGKSGVVMLKGGGKALVIGSHQPISAKAVASAKGAIVAKVAVTEAGKKALVVNGQHVVTLTGKALAVKALQAPFIVVVKTGVVAGKVAAVALALSAVAASAWVGNDVPVDQEVLHHLREAAHTFDGIQWK
ncbi:hypothetical protein [Alicyclobacillus tolerans]|uniref:Uncharacterized protein n=2 Tax=Alicyclobacillus TaxID=29330 RepID=A0ABT9LZY9_9BACL|nr:hypothetical protein [Alicyclobacillus tengchongensis]MDP9729812.1 hypothetical protein [Alicyclobacillus tengchongensis]